MSNDEITSICRSMSDGNGQHAFKKVYVEFYPRLVVFANGFVKNIPEAEDIAEEVMVKLWNNRSNLSAIKNLKFYLFVATKNACLNHIQKSNRYIVDSLEDYRVDVLGITQSPEDKLISDEKLLVIQSAIQNLPPKCKFIFVLIKEDGLKYNEAADLLNVSVKTIETQMSIAFKKIGHEIGFSFPHVLQRLNLRLKAKS